MHNIYRFPALRVRDFRLFWFGQLISLSGTWMHSVAQSWLVYSLTKSPLYLGIVASLSSVPILLFTLIGGSIADRYPKRDILIITQILSIIPALVLGILTDNNIVTVWHVGMVAAFLGTVNAFDIPARQSFLAEAVGRGDITNAIALNSAAFNGARIIGPVAAGLIIANVGIPACFYLNAASFLAVIFALSLIKAKGVVKTYQKGIVTDIGEGWKFIKEDKPILYIMSLISVFSLFGIPYITLLPVLAGDILNVGVRGLSYLVASAGAGSFLAAMIIAFRGEIARKDISIPVSGLVFSLAIFGVSFSGNFHISIVLIFFAGYGIVSFLAISNSFIQQAAPDSIRGRIMGLYTLVFLGFAPIGNALIGVMAHFIGTASSLSFFALLCITGSLVFMRYFRLQLKAARL